MLPDEHPFRSRSERFHRSVMQGLAWGIALFVLVGVAVAWWTR